MEFCAPCSIMRMIGNYAYCFEVRETEHGNSHGGREGDVDKWISFGGGSEANVVDLLKFESDETPLDPDYGRGGLFRLYSPDGAALRFVGGGSDRFAGARGFYGARGFNFAYPDPGSAFCGCDRCRVGGSAE